jgi:hypothetical protein
MDQALEFMDKEDVVPILIICVRLDKAGLTPILLDASPLTEDEHLRVAIFGNILQSAVRRLQENKA